METNYTLKRLKLLGPLFTVFFFAVFIFGSFKAEAQTVEIVSGSQDVCISAFGTSAATAYMADVDGADPSDGNWVWDISTAYGSFVTSTNSSTVQAEWEIDDFNIPGGPGGGAEKAWLRARFTPNGGGQVVSAYYPVNLWVEIYETYAAFDEEGVCFDFGDGVINLTGTYTKFDGQLVQSGLPEGATGQWVQTAGPGTLTFTNDDAAATAVSASEHGVYELTWEISNGSCTTVVSDPITIEFYPDPVVEIAADGNTEICFGETVELYLTIEENVESYQWFKDGVEIAGATSDRYEVTESGDYYVWVWSDEDCGPVESNKIEITISELEDVSITTTDKLEWCADEDISVTFTAHLGQTALGDVAYRWFEDGEPIPGETASSYEATAPGVYHVEVIETVDGVECDAIVSNAITVIEHPLPIVGFDVEDVCDNEDVVASTGGIVEQSLLEEIFTDWVPAGWTNSGWTHSTFGGAHTGSGWAYSMGGGGKTLTTPAIEIPAGADNVTFSFWMRGESPSYPQSLDVLLSTDGVTFGVVLGQIVNLASSTYSQYTYSLDAYAGQTVYVQFDHTASSNPWWGVLVDNVNLTFEGPMATEGLFYAWFLNGDPVGGDAPVLTIPAANAPVGEHTIRLEVTDENNCTGFAEETFTVHPLPYAEIDAPADVCFDTEFDVALEGKEDFGSVYTVTWTITGPEGTAVVVQTEADTPVGGTFDPADFTLPYVTGQVINVEAHIVNQFGCEFTTDADILVLERPWIVENNILAPQVGEVEKIVFCNIPKDLVKLKGDGEPMIHDLASCVDDPADASILFQWQWRYLGETSWNPAAGNNNSADYELPRHTQSVQYRRLAKPVGCDCPDNLVEWWPSNVITLHIVPSISALPTATDDVCFSEEASIDITGNILYIDEYDDEGNPTGDQIPYVTGEWTLPTGLVFAEGFTKEDAMATINAQASGDYNIDWTLEVESFVYYECLTEGYCCEFEVTGRVSVMFEDIFLTETAPNFGLDEEYCLGDDEVVLQLPVINTIPPASFAEVIFYEDFESPVTGWVVQDLVGNGHVWNFGRPRFFAAFDGDYAIADSDAAGSGAGRVHTTLTSPAIDLTGLPSIQTLELSFKHYYNHLGAGNARVQVSADGTSWTTLATYTSTQPVGAEVSFELEGFETADELYVRFEYDDGFNWAWYWIVDDVTVSNVPDAELAYEVFVNGSPITADAEGNYVFDPSAVGTYEFVYKGYSILGCVASATATTEVLELPIQPMAELVDVCFDGEDHAFEVTTETPDGYALWWRERLSTSPLMWTDWSNDPLPEYAAVGSYHLQLKHIRIAAPNCEGEVGTADLIIRALPEISSIEVTSENTCYGEVIEVTVEHTAGATLDTPAYDGAGWDGLVSVTTPDPDITVLTFAGESLDIGLHSWVFTVSYDYVDGPVCTSVPSDDFVFTVTPPVYATFSPFYRKDADGNIINIAEGTSIDNPTGQNANVSPELITYVPIQVADDNGLFVEFSEYVTSAGPGFLPLPDVDQGEFILLEKKVGESWHRVDIKVTYPSNKKAYVRPFDFANNLPVDLEWDTEYRLSHQNVYKTSCGAENLVEYRLSKIAMYEDGEFVGYGYDEYQTNAYSKNTAVYFRTMPESFANLPIVYPTDDDARCKKIYVEFANPVSYRSLQEITEDGDPTFKFDLQKKVNGIWVSQPIIDYVGVYEFVDVEPTPATGPTTGPTEMVVYLTKELDYGADYRIAMNPVDLPIGTVYGFWDLVLDMAVLDVPVAFDTQNTGLGGGWSWSTSPYYPVVFDIEPWPTDWFGEQTAAASTMNNIVFSMNQGNDFEDLVQYVYDVDTETYSLVKNPDAYDVDFYGGNFTVTAVPGEGYRFLHWRRSTDGGQTFGPALPTARPVNNFWWTEGYDYFPAQFTWRPDTFQVRTSAHSDLVDAWLFPSCDEELAYKAEFAKNRYTVRSWPAKEDAPSTINNNVGVATTIGGDFNKIHGTTVTIEATPKAGYYFKGWNLSDLPSSIEVTEVYTPPAYEDILNPLDHTAVLELKLLGPLSHNSTFTVYALFDVFEPKIYAAAQGIRKDESIEPNITNIEFKTLFVANIQQTGLEQAGVFAPDGSNFYEWATFVYGNPSYPPNVANSPIEIRPLDVPCEYVFNTWERWDPTIGEDGAFRPVTPADGTVVGEFFTFIPVENYRLRATFDWREDVSITVDHDTEIVTDPNATGTITHRNVTQGTGPWQNDPSAKYYEPWDVIEMRIFPRSGYFAYGWVDGNGDPLPVYDDMDDFLSQTGKKVGGLIRHHEGTSFPYRLSSNPMYPDHYRTAWRYVVGCEDDPVDLQVVIAPKRFQVIAEIAAPVTWGEITDYNPAFQVDHPIVINGNDHLFGFWTEDQLLGFQRTAGLPTNVKTITGWFEKGADFDVLVKAITPSPTTQDIDFHEWRWTEVNDQNEVVHFTHDNEQFEREFLDQNLRLRAHFRDLFDPNKWLLVLDADPEEAAEGLTASPAQTFYYEGDEVTVTATSVEGYDFSHWTASEDIDKTDLELKDNPLTFEMPDMPDDAPPYGEIYPITLTAHFDKTEYAVMVDNRTYIKTDDTPAWPYTDGNPYLIGEEQGVNAVTGGEVVSIVVEDPTTFDTDVTIKVNVFDGFRLINFMVGNVDGGFMPLEGGLLGDGSVYGIQINPSADESVEGFGTYEFTFTIPFGDDHGIWFEKVWDEEEEEWIDVLRVYAIYVETGNFEFPSHRLHTMSDPAGYGIVRGDVAFESNESPDGLYVFGSEVIIGGVDYTQDAVIAGYVFKDWTVNKRSLNGALRWTQNYNNLDAVTMEFTNPGDYMEVIANYEAITYQLIVESNNVNWGTVELLHGHNGRYQIGDVPIPVKATIKEETCDEYFLFHGWYRDAAHKQKLVYPGQGHVTDLQFNFIPEVVQPYPDTDITLYAKFEARTQHYDIDLFVALNDYTNHHPAAGDLTPTPAEGPWFCGDMATIKATENPGYLFQYWVDANGITFTEDFEFNHIVAGNVSFTAVYEYDEFELVVEASPEEGGLVDGDGFYRIIDTPVVSATPNTGWEFINWTENGQVVNPAVLFADGMPARDVHLVANFEMIDYTLTVTPDPEEGGAVSGGGVYNFGDEVTVEATPATGWLFENWTENGQVVDPAVLFADGMPARDVNLVANFVMDEFLLSLEVYPLEEAGNVMGGGEYNYQQEVFVTAIANVEEGWEFIKWIDADGATVSEDASFTYEMPAADVTLTAVFDQATSSIAGQVRYFNQFGTPMPSPSSFGYFVVELHDADGLVDTQNARLINGKLSAFNFDELPVGEYTIRVIDPGYLANRWSTLSVNSGDALIAQQMGAFTEMPGRPWLGDADEGYSDFGVRLGDVNDNDVVDVMDAYSIMQRVVGQTSAFDVPDFQMAAAFGPFVGDPRMAIDPEDMILFQQNGNVYEGAFEIVFGDHTLDLFFVATADLRARSIPQQAKEASIFMEYHGVQNVGVGEEVVIPVSLTGDAKLGAMTIDLTYDNSLLEIISVVGDELVYNITENTITIASIEPVYAIYGESLVGVVARVISDVNANDRFFEVAPRSELTSPEVMVIEGVNFSTYALSTDDATGIDEVYDGFSITNFPNPFSEQTIIRYQLPETADVSLKVFNQQGQVVRTLVSEKQTANVYEVVFEREALNPGVYFYRIVIEGESGSHSSTNSMIIMR